MQKACLNIQALHYCDEAITASERKLISMKEGNFATISSSLTYIVAVLVLAYSIVDDDDVDWNNGEDSGDAMALINLLMDMVSKNVGLKTCDPTLMATS
ncbi:Hypothetical predicted protein [Octopus vulgaris]|uniref:Uncharacterized protein n=1 Tax=Octopus vulgaris TaxID=6645 RepID=A0AA36APU6_OCTVU|nr:Hypothetical predicted protein [Octopus vulgaris]